MPLRCLDEESNSIQSFDLETCAWNGLNEENRRRRHLRMPCCKAAVVLKRSVNGTQFFAHKAIGPCQTKPESAEHIELKMMAVRAARASGWQASTEVSGVSPTGMEWRADVLVTKGDLKRAIEVQWSGQTSDETLIRQTRYAESGIVCLWLFRQPGFPVQPDLPAVCIGGSLADGFEALVPSHRLFRYTVADRKYKHAWEQVLPMDEFLKGLFERRLRYGFSGMATAHLSTAFRRVRCRTPGCNTTFAVACGITMTVGRVSKSMDLIKTIQGFELSDPLQSALSRSRDRLADYQGSAAPACPACHVGYGLLTGRKDPDFRIRMSVAPGGKRLAAELAGEISSLGWWMDLPSDLPRTMEKLGYDYRYRNGTHPSSRPK
jgi:hypothetical protein